MPEARKNWGLWNSGRRSNWAYEIRFTAREFPNYPRLVMNNKVSEPQSITEVLHAQRSVEERRSLAVRLLEERRLARSIEEGKDEGPYGEAEKIRISHAKTVALDVVSRRSVHTPGFTPEAQQGA